MSLNSGIGDFWEGRESQRAAYAHALTEFRDVLANTEVVGYPKKDAELAELRRLIGKYPDEARAELDKRARQP